MQVHWLGAWGDRGNFSIRRVAVAVGNNHSHCRMARYVRSSRFLRRKGTQYLELYYHRIVYRLSDEMVVSAYSDVYINIW